MNLILPESMLALLKRIPDSGRHPGLQLDKFSPVGNQQAQKKALDQVCQIRDDNDLLDALLRRRQQILAAMAGVKKFSCVTAGPMTLHLSRASALENAGICLHPLYGFAYLPGSGLKGMARAFAETIWLPGQYRTKGANTLEPADEDEKLKAQQAWRKIEDVFGWAPNPDRREQIHNPAHPATARRENDNTPDSPLVPACSGSIVFHDAWPAQWPELFVDIVNNHHPKYYTDDGEENPPGDWEDPCPVYFLAVKPRTTFTFSLSKRHPAVPDELLTLAQQWLLGALCYLGAGAKTNTGYGMFRPCDEVSRSLFSEVENLWNRVSGRSSTVQQPLVQTIASRRAVFETTLELITPAFLAGADQYGPSAAEGCDLRPATLRGHLRWWWRTMHAGFLDVKTLHALEAAIWGDTQAGSAVQVVVKKINNPVPQPYDKRGKANFNDRQKQSEYGIPGEDAKKVTQGLWYISYGMDEKDRRRYCLEAGARWTLRLIARSTQFFSDRKDVGSPKEACTGKPLTAEQILNQAKAALWLLCYFGGVGSKARKGFGSLAADGFCDWSVKTCRMFADELRTNLRLPNHFNEKQAHSPSLEQMLEPVEVSFSPLEKWSIWCVLDQVGFAYQVFAKKYKHDCKKKALGLPRRIGSPVKGQFNPKPPVKDRHASPVHIHVARAGNSWVVRCVAFPAAYLPDLMPSCTFLGEFLKGFRDDLERRAKLVPLPMPSKATVGQQVQSQSGQGIPRSGDHVEAVLLEEKTRKGGWKARHEPSGLVGPIQNSTDVPNDKKPGDKLMLIVASANPREIAFRYPTPQEEERAKKVRDKADRIHRKGKSGRGS